MCKDTKRKISVSADIIYWRTEELIKNPGWVCAEQKQQKYKKVNEKSEEQEGEPVLFF